MTFNYLTLYPNPSLPSFIPNICFLLYLGIRILYTDNLRQHDTGMILIGTEVNFLHMIPPFQKSFLSLGRCTSECTSKVCIFKSFMLLST